MKTDSPNAIDACDLLPAAEVAEFLGVKTETLRRWRQLKKGPPYFQPWPWAGIRYPRKELADWIAKHTQGMTGDAPPARAKKTHQTKPFNDQEETP